MDERSRPHITALPGQPGPSPNDLPQPYEVVSPSGYHYGYPGNAPDGQGWVSNRQFVQMPSYQEVPSAPPSQVEAQPPFPFTLMPPPNKRRSRRKILLLCCLSALVVFASLGGVGVYLYTNYSGLYTHDKAEAQDGVTHLQNAQQVLKGLLQGTYDSRTFAKAHQEFADAFTDFSQLNGDLQHLPAIAASTPKYGPLLTAAEHILPIALELSRGGMISCDMLSMLFAHLSESVGSKSQGFTLQNLAAIKQYVAQIQQIFDTATAQIAHLQASDLQVDARIGPAVAAFRADLPKLQSGLRDVQSLLGAAPALLGLESPTYYLIELLDSTELRPGGGFVGNYGIATVSGGRIASVHIEDTYLLDDAANARGYNIPFPRAYQWFPLAPSWSLRDSNLDANFPTEARYAEQIYSTETKAIGSAPYPVQGVITMTPQFVENILKITGPIYVSEYHETITVQNLVDRIHYHQLNEKALSAGDIPSPDGHSSLRKRFTELLSEHLFSRLQQLGAAAMPKLVAMAVSALHTKDLQMYFNSETAESLLAQYQVDSTIQAPRGDSLFVVDANIISSTANAFMTTVLHDQITLTASGDAVHHMTLVYAYPITADEQQNDYGGKHVYRDYVRVYVPPGSTLQVQNGWDAQGTIAVFGREVWAGIFLLPKGQTGSISLTWTVHSAAVKDASGWHYRYLIQEQPATKWHLEIQLALPVCAHIIGKPENVAINGQLNHYLTTDLDAGVDYNC